MNPRLLLCLVLVLSLVLTGCTTAKFRVISDEQRLTENRCIVAEAACLEATPKYYTTFRDRYFRILAMPPHVRWSATFRMDKVLKGNCPVQTFTLSEAVDAESPYSRFAFKTGKNYLVGFNQISNGKVQDLAVFDRSPDLFQSQSSVK